MASSTTAGFTPVNSYSQMMYLDIFRASNTTSTTSTTMASSTLHSFFGNLFQERIEKAPALVTPKKIMADKKVLSACPDLAKTAWSAAPLHEKAESMPFANEESVAITRKGCLKKNYAIERRPVSANHKFIVTNVINAGSISEDEDDSSSDSDSSDDDEINSKYDFTNFKYVQVRPPNYIDPKKRSRTPLPAGEPRITRKVSFDEALNETRLFCHDLDSDEQLGDYSDDSVFIV